MGTAEIAMIQGPRGWKSVDDRTEGFKAELAANGLEPNNHNISEGDWSYSSGYRAMGQLINNGASFSAVFVHNDQMAIGAMRALREVGKHIPNDVALVSYDDIPAAEYTEPPLTTIRQPMREVGRVAARLLIRRIELDNPADGTVLLDPELVRRGT